MKKRLLTYISVILMVAMVFTFAGCTDKEEKKPNPGNQTEQGTETGDDKENPDDQTSEKEGEDNKDEENKNDENKGDDSNGDGNSDDENQPGEDGKEPVNPEDIPEPVVTISTSKNSYVIDEKNMAETAYDSIVTSKMDPYYSGLSKALASYNRKAKNYCEDTCAILGGEAYEIKSEVPYAVEKAVKIKRLDKKVFSFVEKNYYNAGGVHPSHYEEGYSYDSQTGKRLELTDVVTDVDAIKKKVAYKLKKNYDKESFYENYSEMLENMFTVIDNETGEPSEAKEGTEGTSFRPTWYLKDDRIVFIFNEYEIGPYAAGKFVVAVYFKGNEDLFNGDYI